MKKLTLSQLVCLACLSGLFTAHPLVAEDICCTNVDCLECREICNYWYEAEDIYTTATECICRTNVYCIECEEICNNWCTGWTLAVDYLYWQPIRQNTNYALANPTGIGDAERFSVDMEWASGYRLALAKVWGCSLIDTEVRYTSFDYSSGTSQKGLPSGGGFIIPTRSEPAGQGPLFAVTQSVSGEYKIDYDVVDLQAGHTWECECFDLAFRPFLGVKLAFIEEKLISFAVTDVPNNLRLYLDKNEMDLYGLSVGFDGHWRAFGGLLSLNFKAASSLLYGNIERRFHRELGGAQLGSDIVATIHQLVPEWEVLVGVGSEIWCTNCFSLDLSIGYDFQGWLFPDFLYPAEGLNNPGLNPDPAVTYPGQDPNAFLALHGLHVRVAVNY